MRSEPTALKAHTPRQRQASLIRLVRRVHRWTGLLLMVFLLQVAVTGILLGWKKHSAGLILAPTETGTSIAMADWLPLDSLDRLSRGYLRDSVSATLSDRIDRMEVRGDKGVLKVTFRDHYWGLQLDGATGRLLRVERRHADLIEQIHDGSIVDRWLKSERGCFKRFFTTLIGTALLTFCASGFWLWYGPRRMRRAGASGD